MRTRFCLKAGMRSRILTRARACTRTHTRGKRPTSLSRWRNDKQQVAGREKVDRWRSLCRCTCASSSFLFVNLARMEAGDEKPEPRLFLCHRSTPIDSSAFALTPHPPPHPSFPKKVRKKWASAGWRLTFFFLALFS